MTQSATSLILSLDDNIDLRPFPAAANQLRSACEQADVTAKEIASIIKHDPALSLRILQVANSPLYGFSGAIRTVDHAAVVLGLRTVKDVAVSLAVGEVFGNGCPQSAGRRRQLWTHSLACGCFAGMLADCSKQCAADEAFLAGILHDVGKLLLFDHSPEHYAKIFDQPGDSLVSAEMEVFGVDHPSLGQRSGECWGLPDEICEAISCHHKPDEANFASELVQVVAVANELAHAWHSDHTSPEIEVVEILEPLGMNLSPEEIGVFEQDAMAQLSAVIKAYC